MHSFTWRSLPVSLAVEDLRIVSTLLRLKSVPRVGRDPI